MAETKRCPACDGEIELQWKACPHCGSAISGDVARNDSNQTLRGIVREEMKLVAESTIAKRAKKADKVPIVKDEEELWDSFFDSL